MKTIALLSLLLVFCLSSEGQTEKGKNMNNELSLEKRIGQIEDRIALKELVDTFSNLADVKDIPTQVLLFTEDAVVQSISEGKPAAPLTGRKQLADAFTAFLDQFDVIYHINGQQTLKLNGDKAAGTAYCQVVLIGNENGKRMKTTMGVIYKDEYVRRSGRWLIAKRQSNFTWREKTEMKQ